MPDDRRESGRDVEQKHSCTFSMDRIKKGPDREFYNIQEGMTLYKDPTNPIQDAIRWDDNPHMGSTDGFQGDKWIEEDTNW